MDSIKVDLAHEPDFVLGRLTVRPPMRELLRDDGAREVLEHRVARVLVALAKAQGAVVSRDDLLDSCWDGLIVGEDAINRAIWKLRKVAEGIGAGSFTIETATKIGYSLVHDGVSIATPGQPASAAPRPPRSPRPTRRAMLAGAAAVGALAATGGALLYRREARPAVSAEILAMVAQAEHLWTQNTREGQYQGIGVLRRVVELAPEYADGWGHLGIAYAVTSHYREQAEGRALRARAEAAGRRALELDPGNAYGELALSIAVPFIGHWKEREWHLARARADRPDDDQVLFFSAVALNFLGRNVDSLSFYQKIRGRPLPPSHYNNYIRALWCAGRIEETDRAMEDAGSLYPTQASVWNTRFNILVHNGRFAAARALVEENQARPDRIADVQSLLDWAEAMESRDPAKVDAFVSHMMTQAPFAASVAASVITDASAFGRLDEAFEIAEAYYFGRGFVIPDYPTPGSDFSPDQRQTRLLFEPPTAPMRADPRFARLVEEIGLDRYWRESGAQPDYRRV